MKSLVEEASSITKAIEKAWIRAGQPQSFSVKIFETPEVGFLGFTKKSAKVGIFFEEPAAEKTNKKPYHRPANKGAYRKPAEHNAPRKEQRRDNQDREQRQADDRPRENRRQADNKDNNQNHSQRPQKRLPRRESARQDNRPQRDRQERPTQERKPESREVQKQVTAPVSKPQETAPAAPAIKRPPKFSGRRFSGYKKDNSTE